MSVEFTAHAEKRRVEKNQENRKGMWELKTTTSFVEALRFAKENGWEQKKVQVRATKIWEHMEEWDHDVYEYTVEPFEKDCGCPNILKYEDYFDEAPHS